MNRKKMISILLAAVMSVALGACGSATPKSPDANASGTQDSSG